MITFCKNTYFSIFGIGLHIIAHERHHNKNAESSVQDRVKIEGTHRWSRGQSTGGTSGQVHRPLLSAYSENNMNITWAPLDWLLRVENQYNYNRAKLMLKKANRPLTEKAFYFSDERRHRTDQSTDHIPSTDQLSDYIPTTYREDVLLFRRTQTSDRPKYRSHTEYRPT